ncbi:MAG: hypothetical protein HUU43_12415 [Ignavibacteriaceae bacterium]|nr:hypothetical protein [Ignavibacteriaceae bacterium]
MKENDIKRLWGAESEPDSGITKKINDLIEDTAKLKAGHELESMRPMKIFAMIIAVFWVTGGIYLISNYFVFDPVKFPLMFTVSASVQIGLVLIALLIYLRQHILISQVDITEPVAAAQQRISELKTSTLLSARVLFLQLPVWTTFYWNNTIFENWEWYQWFIQITFTLLFAAAGLWLFFNLKYENRDKKWFRFIMGGSEWDPLMKAWDILEEIKDNNLNAAGR